MENTRENVRNTGKDEINHPSHYTQGKIETIDVIEDWALGFHEGNILKYLSRWKQKNGVKDLKKAMWYLQRLIDLQVKYK